LAAAKSFMKAGLYYADRLTTVEINGSFYALQRPRNYEAWYAETPAQFVFSVKGPRFISHMKKLRDVEIPLANFYASGVLALREKLGPILWQLPPNLGFDQSRLAQFFAMLPRTTFAAARLAKRHEERLADRALTRADADRPLRYALEVRHASYQKAEFVELMRDHADKASSGRIGEILGDLTPEAMGQLGPLAAGGPNPATANSVKAVRDDGADYVFDVTYTGDSDAKLAMRETVRQVEGKWKIIKIEAPA
jgi:hypothetical protein